MATTHGYCNLKLSPYFNENKGFPFTALVLTQLTSQLPSREICKSDWPHLRNLQLADSDFLVPKHIDCLLGADVYSRIVLSGIQKGQPNTPLAQNTLLGWIITGTTCSQKRDHLDLPAEAADSCVSSCFTREDSSIADALTKFWEVEQIPKKSFLTPDEKACEEIFRKTFFRINGRFGVRIPFKTSDLTFPGTKDIAIKSYTRLKTRLAKQPRVKEAYDKFLKEYLELGHMELISSQEIERNSVYYIPHHAVFHNSKIKVVFNASMPAYNGKSLYSCMHTGVKLQ